MPLPPMSTEAEVSGAGAEEFVRLWRGTNVGRAESIQSKRTAGGSDVDIDCGTPTEADILAAVGGRQPGQGTTTRKVTVEYTTNERIAKHFAAGAIVCINIKKKYLTKGSGTEGGWCVYPSAPIMGAEWIASGTAGKVKLDAT